MAPFYESLDRYMALETGWDSYDAPPPNSAAQVSAVYVLRRCETLGVLPQRVLPSAEGGIGIVFKGRSHIECFNNGEVLAAISNDDGIDVWDVDDMDAAIMRVSE